MTARELAALQAEHFHQILGDRPAPAVRRSIEDIRREHERHWRSADQHWQDVAMLLDEIRELQSTIDDREDLAAAEHAETVP